MNLLDRSLEEYLQLVSTGGKEAAGGSTLAVSAAMGSQLVVMYCDISLNKLRKYENKNLDIDTDSNFELLAQGKEKARILGEDFKKFVEKDVEVVTRYFKTKTDDAAKELALIPFLTAQRSKELLQLIFSLQNQGHGPLEPDLMAASYQGRNALFGSLVNTYQNLNMITDSDFTKMLNSESRRIEDFGREIVDKIDKVYYRSANNG